MIEYFRDQTAERWGTEWRNKYRITISFADGSPARISAINASLRPYRPSFMHMWELKTFWHHAKMCLDDVEVHSFEDIDTAPPVPISQADSLARAVAHEMMRFKQEVMTSYRQGLCKDLSTFWLRKTKKPVLAVLLVQKEGQDPIIYRGCNMEVSMPTGSLCAERNAIGSALASDLTLNRRDLKIVAVLSLSFKAPGGGGASAVSSTTSTPSNTLMARTQAALAGGLVDARGGGGEGGPERALDQAFASVHHQHHHHQEIRVTSSLNPAYLSSTTSTAALKTDDKDFSRSEPTTPRGQTGEGGGGGGALAAMEGYGPHGVDGEEYQLYQEGIISASPPRVTVIRSYSVADLAAHHETAARAISVDHEDLNPLKPCGACMEWLKKIAEKNPTFRVATFTDESMSGIYTEYVSYE